MRLREKLLDTMWDEVGVVRDRAGIERGLAGIDAIEAELLATGVADAGRHFNLTWHDWLNLRSLCEVSRVIALAALQAREFPRRALSVRFSRSRAILRPRPSRWRGLYPGRIEITDRPVEFTHVKPGQTLLRDQVAAE